MVSTDALANLARIGQLKIQAPNIAEVQRMLVQARTRFADAQLAHVSVDGRFASIYGAAHAAALAALRWHGYRSENRFIVFQCLPHTLGWPAHRWRVLDAAHQKRNLAEYEGYLDIQESMVVEMVALVKDLIADVDQLTQPTGQKI
jgi:hypothetical protein